MLFFPKSAGGQPSTYGIKSLSNFHEHIGCTPCGAFEFEAVRKGPVVVGKARPGNALPRLVAGIDVKYHQQC